ncbi:thioredoxin-like domain-containing protein [Streptomyces sp. SID13031]|uniref:thioredoxin-like domain-containing protein n=1 Tax=Streptomyces sp. SID13031 TaxID=2706046 RepID=UPI0013CB459F|nr:thioredoxin-like domain-containing protein [Streptomyces sp. SID13031]NEA34324.1 redoxin domain-containing protein [Streptomyces sp. SID13031]
MPVLVAVLIVVGVVSMVNLLLTFGVIGRLREHTEKLSAWPLGTAADSTLAVGDSPGDFAATTTEDEAFDRTSLLGGQVVGFFSPNCDSCKDLVPKFVEHAATTARGKGRVLAVVVVDNDEGAAESLVRSLEPVARVVTERIGGAISSAFKVSGFPAVYVLDNSGTVAASRLAPDSQDRMAVS